MALKLFFFLLQVVVVIWSNTSNYFIMHGDLANIEDYPYHVAIRYKFRYRCGGGLVKLNIVITAAHCIDVPKKYKIIVQAGSSFLNKTLIYRNVINIKIHEKYNSKTLDYDLALLKLSSNFIESRRIQTIQLISANISLLVNRIATVTGFGDLYENGPTPEQLRVINVSVLSNVNCLHLFPRYQIHIERFFCAGLPLEHKKTCVGDSGGPVVIGGKLAGIVHRGTDCVEDQLGTSLFLKLWKFRNWIDTNILLLNNEIC